MQVSQENRVGFSYISIFVSAAEDCQIRLICPAVKRFSRSLFAFFSVNTLFKVTVEVAPPPGQKCVFLLFLKSLTLEGCVSVHFLCAELKRPPISTLCDIASSSGQMLYILTKKLLTEETAPTTLLHLHLESVAKSVRAESEIYGLSLKSCWWHAGNRLHYFGAPWPVFCVLGHS